MAAQGIIEKINGIIVGKPQDETHYEDYKKVITRIVSTEAKRPDLPILYNVNFGHTSPICILPYGVTAEINCEEKSLKLLESAVV
jgi:muramoyltetrapeptide carboxypeptidase LdcA involved in peptidoglycan recycling